MLILAEAASSTPDFLSSLKGAKFLFVFCCFLTGIAVHCRREIIRCITDHWPTALKNTDPGTQVVTVNSESESECTEVRRSRKMSSLVYLQRDLRASLPVIVSQFEHA